MVYFCYAGELVGKLVLEVRKRIKDHRGVLDNAYGVVMTNLVEPVIPQAREKIRRKFKQARLVR